MPAKRNGCQPGRLIAVKSRARTISTIEKPKSVERWGSMLARIGASHW